VRIKKWRKLWHGDTEYHPSRIEHTRAATTVHHKADLFGNRVRTVEIKYRGGNAPVMSGNVLTNPSGYFSKFTKRLAAIEVRFT
jgi:hypothetical protein